MEITTYDLYISRTLGYNTPNTLSRDAASIWSINCCSSSVQPDRMLLPPHSRDTDHLGTIESAGPSGRSVWMMKISSHFETESCEGNLVTWFCINRDLLSKGNNKLQCTQSLRTSAVSGPRPSSSSVPKKPNNHPVSCSKFVTLGSNHLTYYTLDIQESHPPTIQGTPQAPLSQEVEKGFNYINYSLKRCLEYNI